MSLLSESSLLHLLVNIDRKICTGRTTFTVFPAIVQHGSPEPSTPQARIYQVHLQVPRENDQA